jgi:hypothetical protein
MDRFENHGTREKTPLVERILAFPGQAILTTAALPVLAPILIARGVRRAAAAAKAVKVRRALRAEARAATRAQRAARRARALVHV